MLESAATTEVEDPTPSSTMDVDQRHPAEASRLALDALMLTLRHRYESRATAKDVRVSLPQGAALLVPGWVRERAADVLFESGDEDEPSIVEAVLQVLVQVRIAGWQI